MSETKTGKVDTSSLQPVFVPEEEFLKQQGMTPQKAKVGAYEVVYPADDAQFGAVASGAYEGEIVGPCGQGSESLVIGDVYLRPEEARAIRDKSGVEPSIFFLDEASTKEGRYCVRIPHAKHIAHSMDCADVQDTSMPDWIENAFGITRYLPVPGNSRCAKVMEVLEPSILVEGVKVGAGFVGAGIAGELIFKRSTGKSLFGSLLGKLRGSAGAGGAPVVSEILDASGRPFVRTTLGKTERSCAKTLQKGAKKLPLPWWAKATIFVGIQVGGALLLSGDAEASTPDSPAYGLMSDGEYVKSSRMYRDCGASTACYFANWALTPVGWIADSVSSEAY